MDKPKKMSNEYESFDRTMQQLVKVSHAELRAALDAEKAEKKRKRKSGTTRQKGK